MDKSKYFLDLSKCTEDEQIKVIALLPIDSVSAQIYFMIRHKDWNVINKFNYIFFNDKKVWQICVSKRDDKTELTYPEFIKLFDGGEEENNGWIKIESEADLPKEDIVYWVVQNGEVVDMENWELTLNFHNKRGVTHYQPIQKPEPPNY